MADYCKNCEFYCESRNMDGSLYSRVCEREDYDSDVGWFDVTPYKKACGNFTKKERKRDGKTKLERCN